MSGFVCRKWHHDNTPTAPHHVDTHALHIKLIRSLVHVRQARIPPGEGLNTKILLALSFDGYGRLSSQLISADDEFLSAPWAWRPSKDGTLHLRAVMPAAKR